MKRRAGHRAVDGGAFSRQGAGLTDTPQPGIDLGLSANSYTPNGRTLAVSQIGLGNLYVPSDAKGASVYRATAAVKF